MAFSLHGRGASMMGQTGRYRFCGGVCDKGEWCHGWKKEKMFSPCQKYIIGFFGFQVREHSIAVFVSITLVYAYDNEDL